MTLFGTNGAKNQKKSGAKIVALQKRNFLCVFFFSFLGIRAVGQKSHQNNPSTFHLHSNTHNHFCIMGVRSEERIG
jgi:hypothetical protein